MQFTRSQKLGEKWNEWRIISGKIIPEINEDEEAAAFTGEIIPSAELTRIIREVPGGEEVDEDNVTEWLVCDKNDHGFESTTDEQIVEMINRREENDTSDKEWNILSREQLTARHSSR